MSLQRDLMTALVRHETLRSLQLFRVDLTDEAVVLLATQTLPTMPALDTLILRWNRVADAGCCALADALRHPMSLAAGTVTTLSLSDNRDIGHRGLTAMAAMLTVNRTLTAVDLRDTATGDVANGFAVAVRGNWALRKLFLSTPEANASMPPPPEPKPLSADMQEALRKNRSLTAFECESFRDDHIPLVEAICARNKARDTSFSLIGVAL
jgi:hypothetical protein